jgi:hypothetical protein
VHNENAPRLLKHFLDFLRKYSIHVIKDEVDHFKALIVPDPGPAQLFPDLAKKFRFQTAGSTTLQINRTVHLSVPLDISSMGRISPCAYSNEAKYKVKHGVWDPMPESVLRIQEFWYGSGSADPCI